MDTFDAAFKCKRLGRVDKGVSQSVSFFIDVAFEDYAVIRGWMSNEEGAYLEPLFIKRGTRSGRCPREYRLVLD
jgi:hypothetical protein